MVKLPGHLPGEKTGMRQGNKPTFYDVTEHPVVGTQGHTHLRHRQH